MRAGGHYSLFIMYKQLLSTFIAHSIGLQRNRVYCWKWSSSPSASVQNRVQISVHSPVHESSPESTVQVLHQPVPRRPDLFNCTREKRGSLVKLITCVTSGGTNFHIWHNSELAKIKPRVRVLQSVRYNRL